MDLDLKLQVRAVGYAISFLEEAIFSIDRNLIFATSPKCVAQLHASRGRYSKDLIKLTKWKESVGR